MKKKSVCILLIFAAVIVLTYVTGESYYRGISEKAGLDKQEEKIYKYQYDMIVDSPDSQFWQAVYDSAKKKAAPNNVLIEIMGPEYCFEENGRAREITEGIFKDVPDLDGIYLTSHGEEGVCEAIAGAGKAGQVKMVANDFMGRNYELMRERFSHFLIGQDARIQGYEPVMILFRLLFNGEAPERAKIFTEIYIRNEYTIPEGRH